MIKKLDGFIQDGMSFKPLDRSVIRTKDLMVDGESFTQYYDPFTLAANNMWQDISAYSCIGETTQNFDGLKVKIPTL